MPNDIMLAKVFSNDAEKDNIIAMKIACKPKLVAFAVLVICACAVLAVSYFIWHEINAFAWVIDGVLFAFALYNLFVYIHIISTARKDTDHLINIKNNSQIFFYNDRPIYSDKTSTVVVKYKYVIKAYETKDYFHIFVTPFKAYSAIKSGFMFQHEKEVLSKFLSSKLEKKFKVKC